MWFLLLNLLEYISEKLGKTERKKNQVETFFKNILLALTWLQISNAKLKYLNSFALRNDYVFYSFSVEIISSRHTWNECMKFISCLLSTDVNIILIHIHIICDELLKTIYGYILTILVCLRFSEYAYYYYYCTIQYSHKLALNILPAVRHKKKA